MESQNDLNETIFLTTSKIQEEFPELTKYLGEIPENSQSNTEKGVNKKALEDYLESLNYLLETYEENVKKL
ncbi:hypothetical protein [Aquimarina muelleri]|uniref:Uncharacterized protein n=1 Tax=Aquimarina muelleri TaxID=279356 RepID=A0A918JUP3_9FLAO|nr:hypothetical protein [Aquimarina muelleri]MCX2763935.1 hypothetical protein [Aquimarina muelleri]GGX11215.1 hypothetical protein GCM10007384_11280 [Aquimarina muelleri]